MELYRLIYEKLSISVPTRYGLDIVRGQYQPMRLSKNQLIIGHSCGWHGTT